MPINKIKIFNSRYNKLLKFLDFITINIICLIYVKIISPVEYPASLLIGLAYSVLFITQGTFLKIYTAQFRQGRFSTAFHIIVSLVVAGVLTVSLYSTSMILLNLTTQFDLELLLIGMSKVSAVIFFSLFLLRLIIARFLFPKSVNVAILGITLPGLAIEQALRKEYSRSQAHIKFYEDRLNIRDSHFFSIKRAGNSRDLLALAKSGEVDEIYISLPMVAQQRIRHFLDEFSDSTVDVFIVPDLLSYSSHISQLRMFGNIQTISIFTSPFEDDGAIIKRIEDIILGTLFTLVSLPLMLITAIGIKLTSPGPIIFKQSRYGLNGKEIKIWKFRTMNVMENSSIVTQATRNDPRVTRFGAFLRRTSLDELPQFFNVLQGTMSIVGPRPHAVAHNEEYRKLVENYMIRHKVKPGITGLAQINGYRGETDTLEKMEKRVLYDLEYIQSWSLFLDIKIVFLTFFRGFVGKNAF
ncbi:undecaprenyl-phosphate glucose phosphotransferase [Salmonella enterica subsp. enterica serovar Choleraesuis]|nr:undecaprenyl-phosphate glucose phosphotransferase [Salmonella enterica subsp. enterica serovar Choleraesuis]